MGLSFKPDPLKWKMCACLWPPSSAIAFSEFLLKAKASLSHGRKSLPCVHSISGPHQALLPRSPSVSPADVQFQAPHALTRFPMLADGAWSGFRGPWGQRNRAGFFRIKEGRDSNQLGQPSQAQAASCRTGISQSPARHWGLSPKASLGESTQGRRGNTASAYTWGGILAQPL